MHLFLSFSFTFIPYNKSPIQSYTGVTTYFIQFRAEYTVVLIVVLLDQFKVKRVSGFCMTCVMFCITGLLLLEHNNRELNLTDVHQ